MEQINTLREREIIKLNYGWYCEKRTLNYVSDILEISHGKARNIEAIELRKIRRSKLI